jgi:hypothetical protein
VAGCPKVLFVLEEKTMRVSLLLFAALAVAMPLAAQTGPCSGGSTDPMFTPVTTYPGNILIRFETKALTFIQGGPQATVTGNNIVVSQMGSDVPPIGPPPPCISGALSLGALPPGTYNVAWSYYNGLVVVPFATYNFTLTVPSNVPALDWRALATLLVALSAVGAVMLRR